MMPLDEILKDKQSVAVVDNFWGDSGKGKLIDYLLSKGDYRMVVRFNGGNNAGHTIKVGNVELISHIIPSIQFNPEVKGVIGNGCVIDLESLFKEIDELEQTGIKIKDRLYLSGSANIITNEHVREDLKNSKVGTTGRGIGPAYSDKVARTGIRINDLFDMTLLKDEHKEFYEYFIDSGLINRLY